VKLHQLWQQDELHKNYILGGLIQATVIRTCSNRGCHFEFPAIRQRQRESARSSDPFSGDYLRSSRGDDRHTTGNHQCQPGPSSACPPRHQAC